MRKRLLSLLLAVALLAVPLGVFAQAKEHGAVKLWKWGEQGYVTLDAIVAGTDMTVVYHGLEATITEDGLSVTLCDGSPYVTRDGMVIAALPAAAIYAEHMFFVPNEFYAGFLGSPYTTDDPLAPTLFHGAKFFAHEVDQAVKAPEETGFNRKLLAEISLPTSMGIDAPHIDASRVIVETKLSEYPGEIADALEKCAITCPLERSYTEYEVITGAQSVKEAGMSERFKSYPELRDVDPAYYTVAAFRAWCKRNDFMHGVTALSGEQRQFMKDKQITYDDYVFLQRYYSGGCMEQADAELKKTLIAYYAADIERCAVEQGSIVGKDGGRLDPKGMTARAEAALLLVRVQTCVR